MLLDCFASCTACLSPRWERRAADRGQDPASVPVPVPIPAEAPAADDANGLEPPFKINLSFFTSTGTAETINVTVDHSVPVNVVTNKCLKKLGFKPFPHALPPDLSKLAAKALPGHCGWQKLNFYATRGLSRNIDFVIVGDDYRCDLLLGREFKGVQFKPGVGIYPNLLNPKSKEERETLERQRRERQAREAALAAERKRQSAEKLEQSRKEDPKSRDGAGEGTSA